MGNVMVTVACGSYDRTIALQDQTVRVQGIDLNFIPMYPEELFRRQARDVEFDVAEFSLGTYCLLRARDDDRMVAIPVFPSRNFRHSYIFVNTDRVRAPADLSGKRIGVTEYQQTATVWIRGILSDDYGVAPEDVTWVIGGLNRPKGHGDRVPLALPEEIRTVRLSSEDCLSDMLSSGEIDAFIGAEVPDALHGSPAVRRLFEDSPRVEKEYYQRSGIFPIMHIITIKREIYDRHPWIARNLFTAFSEAQRVGQDRLSYRGGTLYCSLPWLMSHLEELEELSSGTNMFSYGVPSNRRTLETFLRYCEGQHLLERPLSVADLFVFEDV